MDCRLRLQRGRMSTNHNPLTNKWLNKIGYSRVMNYPEKTPQLLQGEHVVAAGPDSPSAPRVQRKSWLGTKFTARSKDPQRAALEAAHRQPCATSRSDSDLGRLPSAGSGAAAATERPTASSRRGLNCAVGRLLE